MSIGGKAFHMFMLLCTCYSAINFQKGDTMFFFFSFLWAPKPSSEPIIMFIRLNMALPSNFSRWIFLDCEKFGKHPEQWIYNVDFYGASFQVANCWLALKQQERLEGQISYNDSSWTVRKLWKILKSLMSLSLPNVMNNVNWTVYVYFYFYFFSFGGHLFQDLNRLPSLEYPKHVGANFRCWFTLYYKEFMKNSRPLILWFGLLF